MGEKEEKERKNRPDELHLFTAVSSCHALGLKYVKATRPLHSRAIGAGRSGNSEQPKENESTEEVLVVCESPFLKARL